MAAESSFAIFDQQVGFYQTITPLALMAFESIPLSAFSLQPHRLLTQRL